MTGAVSEISRSKDAGSSTAMIFPLSKQRGDALEPFAQPLSLLSQEFFGQGVLFVIIRIHEWCRSSDFSGCIDRKQLEAEIWL